MPISAIERYIFYHLLPILAIDMTKTVVRVGTNGRAQIPYDVRTKLGIRDGYQLVIDIEQIIPAEGEVDSEGHNLNDQRRKEVQA